MLNIQQQLLSGEYFTPTMGASVGVFYHKGIIHVQDLDTLILAQLGLYAVTEHQVSVSMDPITMMVSNAMRRK